MVTADRKPEPIERSGSAISVVTRDWRLVKDTESGAVELYRTSDDAADLTDTEPERLAELEWLLEAWREIHQ